MKLNDPTLLRPQCLIGGEWLGAPVDPVDNPATGEVIASVPRFGAVEAEKAVAAAHAAFGPWSKKTAKERAARRAVDPYGEIEVSIMERADAKWR